MNTFAYVENVGGQSKEHVI